MGKTVKVRCNGRGKHVNEIDVEALVANSRETVYRMVGHTPTPQARYVLRCRCADGDVIVTRAMIEQRLRED